MKIEGADITSKEDKNYFKQAVDALFYLSDFDNFSMKNMEGRPNLISKYTSDFYVPGFPKTPDNKRYLKIHVEVSTSPFDLN